MMPTRQGSIRLFQVAGSACFYIGRGSSSRVRNYQPRTKLLLAAVNGLEYLTLFVIVTMHEFGHALACRSVGGRANQIVLWPLGGVAYVDPPPRLAPFCGASPPDRWSTSCCSVAHNRAFGGNFLGWPSSAPDVYGLLHAVWVINLALLIFNVLPVYPLDGGQILRALLWFVLGRARSLMVAVVIGFVGVAGLVALALRPNQFGSASWPRSS